MLTTNLLRRLADFDDIIAVTENPRHRAMIQNFRDHNLYEQTSDIDALLALYADNAEFHIYGGVIGHTAERHHYGKTEIRGRYEALREVVARSGDPASRLEHLQVTDWGVSGVFAGAHIATGRIFADAGFEIAHLDATYVQRQKIAFFRHYQDDGLVRSMTYFTNAPAVEPYDEDAGLEQPA
jgi:ketosteroid isomerase-like protein